MSSIFETTANMKLKENFMIFRFSIYSMMHHKLRNEEKIESLSLATSSTKCQQTSNG
jgi:hypothetical protein